MRLEHSMNMRQHAYYEQRYVIRVVADPHTEVYGITAHIQKIELLLKNDGNYWELCNEPSPYFRYVGMDACCKFDIISCSI